MNESPVNGPLESKTTGGYSLGYLFLLVALFAVVSRQIGPLLNLLGASSGDHAPNEPFTLAALSGVSGAALGLIVGLQHYRRLRGVLLGLLLGLIFGGFAGLVIFASLAFPQLTILVSTAGGVVLLGLAAWVRRIQDDDPVTHKGAYQSFLREWQIESSSRRKSPT